MTNFLTTRDVQELIHVDKSTVYRMAEDGRLPGIKVGRQWRFAADRIAEQFGLTTPGPAPSGADAPPPSLEHLVAPDAAQSIADLLGDLFGLMAVVTDMQGRAITTVANKCGFYSAFAEQPGAAEVCLTGWRQFAEDPNVAPRFVPSHLGFLCARVFVWVDLKPVGMLVVGGVTPPGWPPSDRFIDDVADEIGVDPNLLLDHLDETYDLTAEQRRWTLRLLPQFGDLISQLASARCQHPPTSDAISALPSIAPEGNPS
ncbi:MAG: PocR ligand-binding domain-containing protein [Ilumatobacter sp.]|uniref:PocR ligand-binding domain-containing protein n=1 Tax=Ilumatobacter sp. TaxID=1967498 RepID=UPI00260322D4|nr:PocR ligand-binding domain-containing protein [Ilumatobacter sp.]MDJ0769983.1 PocR ligand-binding domain-containing protein [Ilumatobacter sp.]